MNEFFEQYYQLRKELDEEIVNLERQHKSQLSCKKGCDFCCESIAIFPLEFYAIQSELKNKKLPKRKLRHSFTKSCRFLNSGSCQIYHSRPIICRTQGLPLLYENATGSGFELSVCHLNFKGVDVSVFSKQNALFMPPYNSKLFLLNQQFVKVYEKQKYKAFSRIKNNYL